MEACGCDPFLSSIHDLNEVLRQHDLLGVLSVEEDDKDQYLFLLMSHVVEPFLAQQHAPVAVYNFPPSQAALARIN